MIPKDKAQELYNKYFLLQESATDENGVWIVSALNKGLAKKCALISQEETIKVLKKAKNYLEVGTSAWADIDNDIIFEIEVKQEIQKL